MAGQPYVCDQDHLGRASVMGIPSLLLCVEGVVNDLTVHRGLAIHDMLKDMLHHRSATFGGQHEVYAASLSMVLFIEHTMDDTSLYHKRL